MPVIGYNTIHFPEFFTSDSGYPVSSSVNNAKEAAELIHMQFDRLNLKTGILIAVPVPKEEEADG